MGVSVSAAFAGIRYIQLVLAALCCLAVPISAQALSVQATLNVSTTEKGVPFTLQISLEGSDTPPLVELPSLDGVTIRQVSAGPSNSQSITIVNGQASRRVQRGFIIKYELTAFDVGQVEIPPIYLTVDGQRLKTDLLRVTIVKSQAIEEYLLNLESSVNRAWVGQPITLRTTWMWKEGLGPRRILSFSHPVMLAGNLDVVVLPSKGDLTEIEVNGATIMAAQKALRRDGKANEGLAFDMIVVPREPGRLDVPAATVSFEGIASFRTRRDVFGRTIRDWRRLVISSVPLELSVSPLPTVGRPDDFSGLVGVFEIGVSASPITSKVGDPITLQMTVSGSGYLSSLAEIDVTHLESSGDFRVADQRVDRSTSQFPSSATYRTTVRALHESVVSIPSVRLSYFDPRRGLYAEAVSEPVALDVQSARQVTLRDIDGGMSPQLEGRNPVTASVGIAHNYEGERLLRRQRFDIAPFVKSWRGALLLAAGPLAAGIGTLWIRLRRLVVVAPTARGALTRFRRAIVNAKGDSEIVAAALYDYLCVHMGTGVFLGFETLARDLQRRGVEPLQVDELRNLMESLDASRYGGIKDSIEECTVRIIQWAGVVDPVLSRGTAS